MAAASIRAARDELAGCEGSAPAAISAVISARKEALMAAIIRLLTGLQRTRKRCEHEVLDEC
jgi:hypothetical protein